MSFEMKRPLASTSNSHPPSPTQANDDLIPLSHLALDLDPGEPWPLFLGRRGIAFQPDRCGRDSITVTDVARLIAERRADELRQRERLRVAEEEMVAQDRARRALIWRGVAADRLPVGVSASTAMLAAAKDAQPKRQSVLEEALSNSGEITYHSYLTSEDAS
jgi:hypothetical protein